MEKYVTYKLMKIAALLFVFIELTTCTLDESIPQSVITAEPSGITYYGATLNGHFIPEINTSIGFEYGTTTDYGHTVYLTNIQINENTFTSISYSLTALPPGTTFHYRMKSEGPSRIILGKDMTFTTLPYQANSVVFNPDLTYGTVNDNDGNTYKTIQIGSQTWMAENLKTTKYNDGTSINLAGISGKWSADKVAACCWLNNDEVNFKDTFGALYNWYAVNTGKLCPIGWHVPSNSEFDALAIFLGGPLNLAEKIMETGNYHWMNVSSSTTNESGFTALPGGYRSFNGQYMPVSKDGYWIAGEAYWWTSTEAYDQGAFYWVIYNNSNSVLMEGWFKAHGLSVRCLKD
jgi:uncharacterized protein (TIGR02145 family)